jgi:hypothetical protein
MCDYKKLLCLPIFENTKCAEQQSVLKCVRTFLDSMLMQPIGTETFKNDLEAYKMLTVLVCAKGVQNTIVPDTELKRKTFSYRTDCANSRKT